MSDRIAHRPHYRRTNNYIQPPRHTEKDYLRNRWSFRSQRAHFERHPLGHSLSFVPLGYKLVRGLIVRYA